MIPDLGRVIEDSGLFRVSGCFPDDCFQCFSSEITLFNQLVQICHIGVMVLSMMEIQCSGTDMRGKSIFIYTEVLAV